MIYSKYKTIEDYINYESKPPYYIALMTFVPNIMPVDFIGWRTYINKENKLFPHPYYEVSERVAYNYDEPTRVTVTKETRYIDGLGLFHSPSDLKPFFVFDFQFEGVYLGMTIRVGEMRFY